MMTITAATLKVFTCNKCYFAIWLSADLFIVMAEIKSHNASWETAI